MTRRTAPDALPSARVSLPVGLSSRRIVVLNRTMSTGPSLSSLGEELTSRGLSLDERVDGALGAGHGDVLILWGNAAWFPKTTAALRRLAAAERPFTVIWHAEPLPLPRASGQRWPRLLVRELAKIALRDRRASDVYTNYFTLRRLAREGIPDLLAVSSLERREFLAERGIASEHIPYGYQASDGRDLGLARDIDVLLLGTLNLSRRRRALRTLREHGIAVDARGSYHDPSLWGEERTKLVNRAKIMLNVGRFPGTYAGKRMLIAMACGALVVSDPIFNPAPLIPGTHYVEAPIEELPALITRFLTDDDARLRITRRAHDFITEELTMQRSVDRLLDVVAERLG